LGIVLNYGMAMYWLFAIPEGVTAFGIPHDLMGFLPVAHMIALLMSAASLDMSRRANTGPTPKEPK
jgi:hypothetical protein